MVVETKFLAGIGAKNLNSRATMIQRFFWVFFFIFLPSFTMQSNDELVIHIVEII